MLLELAGKEDRDMHFTESIYVAFFFFRCSRARRCCKYAFIALSDIFFGFQRAAGGTLERPTLGSVRSFSTLCKYKNVTQMSQSQF